MIENYSNVPFSIGEIKAGRESDACHWSPRDALISLLRGIDSKEINPSSLIIVFDNGDQPGSTYYAAAVKGFHKAVGMLTVARWIMFKQDK